MKRPPATREDDDLKLAILDVRLHAGSGEVGRQFGLRAEAVRTITDRIRRADITESGEDPVFVASCYDWSK